MPPSKRLAALLVLSLGLAACSEEAVVEEDNGSVSGDVLEGSASDAMLPLDTVRSRAPRLAAEPGATGEGDAADAALAAEPVEATDEVAGPGEAEAGSNGEADGGQT